MRIEAAQVSSRSKRVMSSRDVDEDGDPDFRNEPKKLPVPKFENRQLANVAKYLEVFEEVVKQNGYEEYMWPLSLRTAVTEIVELGVS